MLDKLFKTLVILLAIFILTGCGRTIQQHHSMTSLSTSKVVKTPQSNPQRYFPASLSVQAIEDMKAGLEENMYSRGYYKLNFIVYCYEIGSPQNKEYVPSGNELLQRREFSTIRHFCSNQGIGMSVERSKKNPFGYR